MSNIQTFAYRMPHDLSLHTFSLHDALPIFTQAMMNTLLSDKQNGERLGDALGLLQELVDIQGENSALFSPRMSTSSDRKSTRLNSSHRCISYAVFCLKKKNAGNIVRLITIS